jgi:dTMP kinase
MVLLIISNDKKDKRVYLKWYTLCSYGILTQHFNNIQRRVFMQPINCLGKLIVVEGTDGSGKSTTCKKFSDYINEHPEEFDGYKAMTLSLPYNDGSELYKKIRQLLAEENVPTDILQSMMIVNMKDTFNNIIIPKLENEKIIIILDRWLLSTLVYNIMNKGNIIDSSISHILSLLGIKSKSTYTDIGIGYRRNRLYIEDFSSYYCNLSAFPNRVFLLSPETGLLQKHSRCRQGDNMEVNDSIDKVYLSNSIYHNIFNNIITGEEELESFGIYSEDSSIYKKIESENRFKDPTRPTDEEEIKFYDYVLDFLKREVKILIQG